MNAQHQIFLQPQDVLFLRGNKLFGDAGSHGESLIPPWPSMAAGALRSRLMADDPSLTAAHLQDPANFTLTAFQLARRDAQGKVQALHGLPADLVVQGEGADRRVRVLRPQALAEGISSSAALQQVPVLREADTRQKVSEGGWLSAEGWARYLADQAVDATQLISSKQLWKLESRVGVGLAADTRRADDGKLFTVQAVAMHKACDPDSGALDVGFLASARAVRLPRAGLVRLGGDGRAASLHPVPAAAQERAEAERMAAVVATRRFKLVLTSPGLFPQGWKPPGVDEANVWRLPGGVTAKLVSVVLRRAEVVSGWDLAAWKPKRAQRVAPTGSVYWFEQFSGTDYDLRKLSTAGLWRLAPENVDLQREAEGFNRCAIGVWK